MENECEEECASISEPPDPDIIEVDPTHRYIRYKDVLGKGAYKTVYKAFDEVDGIEVAWNQVLIDEVLQSPQDFERLYSEVHLLKTLKHQNIIKFYNSWIDDKKKTINIITELFTSGSLRQYRKKHKKVDIKAVKGWARQILRGLNYLHSQNPPIIHRDLKCDNIFINGNHGEVKIGDLGLATIMQQANARSVIGTPEFMAPELYDEEYNELADIYSFGMCMLEMVTFEYPYCECRNSAQIYKKVSSGIKPASLSKVKDPDVKHFIEKCLVPAAERLSAKELINDPFLKVDGLAWNLSLDLPGIVSPKLGAFANRSVLSEEPNKRRQNAFSIDVDAEGAAEPPVITFLESSGDGSDRPCIQVQMANKGFKLRGEMNDENSVSLILRIVDRDGPVRIIHFEFYLDSDTSLLVAGEMVEQLELADPNVMFIAELIDLSLIHLIPNWTPAVAIKYGVAVNGVQNLEAPNKVSQMLEKRDSVSLIKRDSVSLISFHHLFEGFHISNDPPSVDSISVEEPLMPTIEDPDYVKLDEVMSHVDNESLSTTITEYQGSEMSFISAISTDGNYRKCSINTCMSADSGFVKYEYGMKTEVREVLPGVELGACYNDKDIGINRGSNDMPISSCSPSIGSSIFVGHSEDGELRVELEHIEFQYQQAMKELSVKRHEAIVSAMKRLSQRKLESS